jgi:hypothetical protein
MRVHVSHCTSCLLRSHWGVHPAGGLMGGRAAGLFLRWDSSAKVGIASGSARGINRLTNRHSELTSSRLIHWMARFS